MPLSTQYKISVIIPVYNVERYIGKCAHSLFGQTLKDVEYIFVDDCSPDNSIGIVQDILSKYPERALHVKIIRHECNSGVAIARATGMMAATGEYIAHCDPDDWMELNGYEIMYNKAKKFDADVVSCLSYQEPSGKISGITFFGSGLDALVKNRFIYGLCDKIIRTSIIQDHNIYPYPGINYNEDLNVIVRLLCYSDIVAAIDRPLYHHLEGRDGSICRVYDDNIFRHSVPCLRLLDEFLDDFGRSSGDKRISARLTDRIKFWMKSGFLSRKDYDTWRKLWPEAMRAVPHISTLSLREKALLILIHRFPFVVKLLSRKD